MHLIKQIVSDSARDFSLDRGAKSDKYSVLRAMSDAEPAEKIRGIRYNLLDEVH